MIQLLKNIYKTTFYASFSLLIIKREELFKKEETFFFIFNYGQWINVVGKKVHVIPAVYLTIKDKKGFTFSCNFKIFFRSLLWFKNHCTRCQQIDVSDKQKEVLVPLSARDDLKLTPNDWRHHQNGKKCILDFRKNKLHPYKKVLRRSFYYWNYIRLLKSKEDQT